MATGPRPGTPVAVQGIWIALLVGCLSVIGAVSAPGVTAAALARLTGGQFVPASPVYLGDTVTFSITCTGPCKAVEVLLTDGAMTLRLPLSPVGKGVWRGQSKVIPTGTWTVTFRETSTGASQLLPQKLVVKSRPAPSPSPTATPRPSASPPSSPTSRPTPAPTPPPAVTPRPTLAPPSATGAITTEPSPSGSPSPAAPGTGAGGVIPGSPSGTAQPATSPADDRTGSLLLAILLGLFVVGGVAGIAILGARRRRGEDEPRPSSPPAFAAAHAAPRRLVEPGPDPGAEADGPRRRAAWEVYSALEDEPIGTVDELMPGPPGDQPGPPELDADDEAD